MASLHSSAFPNLAIRNSLEDFLTPVTCGFGGANQPDYPISCGCRSVLQGNSEH
jgi:hypothetical protein